jgi:hypothetical protein
LRSATTTIFKPTGDATEKWPEGGLSMPIFRLCCEYDTKTDLEGRNEALVAGILQIGPKSRTEISAIPDHPIRETHRKIPAAPPKAGAFEAAPTDQT